MTPLSITSADNAPLCVGNSWVVRNEELLARIVATLLIGDHAHGRHLRDQLTAEYLPQEAEATVHKVVDLLTVPDGEKWDWKRWHRDGLVFQLISWIAASADAPPDVLLRMPHVRTADKGIDGLMLEPPTVGSARWVAVVSEDKATSSPRRTVRDEIWPDFRDFIAGLRREQLKADLAAMVLQLPAASRSAVLTDALWNEPLHFRAAVTVDPGCDCEPEHAAIFAGYDGVVPSPHVQRRRADSMRLDTDVREWMDGFCQRVVAFLQTIPQPEAPR